MRFYLFLFLILISLSSQAQNFDVSLLKKIHVNRNKNLDGAMHFISNAEFGVAFVAPVSEVLVGYFKKDKHCIEKGLTLGAGLAVDYVISQSIKRTIQRKRPYQSYSFFEKNSNDLNHSFPSGHTSNAFCVATGILLQTKKWYIIAPAFAWAAAVGYSRMHLGVHYPSDVAAGALLGSGSAFITYKANQYLHKMCLKKYPQGKYVWFP
jgi:membrane-associated phospholipid phosphatase